MTVQEMIEILQNIEDKNTLVLQQEFEGGYNSIDDYIEVTVYSTGNTDCIHGEYEYSPTGIKAIIF